MHGHIAFTGARELMHDSIKQRLLTRPGSINSQ